ncbi:MAG TPA: hypothetical protein PKA64_09025 [Myxococcota bacterium]|nr:hypothetical protein [Myxococcota bacterium]
MTNPFEAPSSRGASATGHLDVMKALTDGWEATQRNWLTWLGVGLVGMICVLVAELLCFLPVLVVGPAISWGFTRFAFDALDGEGKFETLFAGFDRLGEIVPPFLIGGLALAAGMIGLYIPFLIVFGVLGAIGSDTLMLVVGLPTSLVFAAVILFLSMRVGFWAHVIVDRKLGGVEAITESWRITEGKVLPLLGLALATVAVALVGYVACIIGIFPAMMIVTGAQASAYRQLAGRSA